MASLCVLTFDHEDRPIQFDTWLDDLQLYLLSDSRDSDSLFDHTSGAAPAPPATGDSATRSLWLTRDVAARLAICNHLPLVECSHFGQHSTAQALYDAVVARYSSPATAALGCLLLPYLFPELSAFASVEDLVSHLRTRDARYRTAAPAEDHFLSLDPTVLTIDLLEQHILAAKTSVVAVGAACGTPRTPFFEGGSPSPLAPSYASAAAVDVPGTEDARAASASAKRRSSKGKGGRGGGGGSRGGGGDSSGGGGGNGGGGSGGSDGGSGGFGGGGGGSGGSGGSGSRGSGGGRTGATQRRGSSSRQRQQQQRRSETPSPQSRAAIFDLDYDGILAAMSPLSVSAEGDCYLCVLPDPGIDAAALGASESVLLRTAPAEALHTFILDSGASRCQVAPPCSCRLLSHQTLLWHHRLGHPSLPRLRGMHSRLLISGLPRSLPPLPPSPAPPCLPCVEGRQRAAPHSSSFPPTTAPLQTLHMDMWGPARVSGQGRERYFVLVVDDYMRYTTVFPLRSKGEVPEVLIPCIHAVRLQLRERFRADLPQNGIAERRIGLVMEVARTSMIHAAAPNFMWSFAVRYAAHQLNLCPPVSLPETSPTLHWTGKVGDASVFWNVTFDDSVPFYRLFPYHSAPLPPPPLFLAPDPPLVDPLPPQGPAPSGMSQVDPLPGTALVEVAVGLGAALGAASGGTVTGGAEPGGAESEGAGSGGGEPGGAEPGGAEPEGVEPGGAESEGAESRGAEPMGTASSRARDSAAGDIGVGGVRVTTAAGGTGGAAAAGPGGARTWGTRTAVTKVLGELELETLRSLELEELELWTLELEALAREALELHELELLTLELESKPLLQPTSALPAPSPSTEQVGGLTECRVPASRPTSPVRTGRHVPQPRPPPFPGTHAMALCPSSVPLRVPPPAPPESSLPAIPDPESDRARIASPTLSRLLATVVTYPSFESTTASALVAELVNFAAAYHLDYATALVAESESASPPSVGGECALGTDVLEDRQEDFECLAVAVPRFASMLLTPEGDPDAPDIPTPLSYAEAITGPYSSQWQTAMYAEMASWKSKGTYVDAVPPSRANIVDAVWIFRVKRLPDSPPAFKAGYVARGFSQQQGVDYFQNFSPTPKMTTLWVLLHVAVQRDYELHSLDFSIAFFQGSLHEEIWLRRPPGFTGLFPACTQWSLRRPVYSLRLSPREWHDTLRTTLVALGFTPSTADPSLFLHTDMLLPPFYVLVYVHDLVFATADTEALTLVLQRFGFQYSSPQLTPLSTSHSLSAPPSDESVEPSGLYLELVGCLMYLMMCTRPDLAYPPSLLARYVAPGRHRKELRWLTYLLSDLGEQPHSPPVLYAENKAMIALCQEHRLEHRTKHIALRYFLARELQQRGQLRLAYVATRANTANIFTEALPPGDHQRFSTVLGLLALLFLTGLVTTCSPPLCLWGLHSDRGGEFSSDLLRDFRRGEGILQSFTLPASLQQNGVAERRISLVMEVARTSMIYAAAPHFLWPFAVRYAAHQLNLWPRFYHPTSRHVLSSQDVTFDEPVPFYRLFPYRTAPLPPSSLFLTPGPPPVDPLSPQGPAPLGVSQVDTLPLAEPVEVTIDSSVARGAASRGAASGGAEPASAERGGAEPEGAEPGGAESEGAETGGAEPEGAEPGGTEPEGAEPRGVESEGAESGGADPRGTASARGPAGASSRLPHWRETHTLQQLRDCPGAGGARAAGSGGARTSGTGAAGLVVLEALELETLVLEALELETLELEALALEALELEALELEVLEPLVLEVLELLLELEVTEVLELLVLEVLVLEVLELPELVVLEVLELETLGLEVSNYNDIVCIVLV
ncbi:unnamed protein product [Closterium sp. NIES-53]